MEDVIIGVMFGGLVGVIMRGLFYVLNIGGGGGDIGFLIVIGLLRLVEFVLDGLLLDFVIVGLMFVFEIVVDVIFLIILGILF